LSDPVYVIGIDLGTTNSVVAYSEVQVPKGREPEIRLFPIPQTVGPGSMQEQEILPSFILLPGAHDVPQGALALPWDEGATMAVGAYARERGAEIPHRLIASAKSWLCHTGVDRNKKILPWGGPEEPPKLSPVEASAAVLGHIRRAWNHVVAAQDPALRFENQEILLTVPASFDAVARDLTVKAAEMAGLGAVILLEEPQAAFYAWIWGSQGRWREKVSLGDMILVCDVGGGTSDFSLIRVTEEDGDLALERIAVGEHLLVGGDNMDLTLAHTVAGRLGGEGKKLDAWQLRSLWQSCRIAKERLLAREAVESWPVTVLGRGRGLIAGTLKTDLTRADIETVLTEGFLPSCDKGALPKKAPRVGMRELGLVYASDPAITRHLAQFLSRSLEGGASPTAVLFNGGVMKAAALRGRILGVLRMWAGEWDPQVRELEGSDYDLAVATGAAYYGLARRGTGVRIKGGLPKSYYIGVEVALPAVPGMPVPMKAVCVAPFGMEEGTEQDLPGGQFGLVVGEPARFEFMGSSVRQEDAMGSVVEEWEEEIRPITTVEAQLEGQEGAVLPITLRVKATEVGTLELWCVSKEDGKQWKLEFDVREKENLEAL